MHRRDFIVKLGALVLLQVAVFPSLVEATKTLPPEIAALQKRWRSLLAENAKVATDPKALAKSKEIWRKELPLESYQVLFEEDTEAPLSSHLNLEKRAGIFVCRACRLPLFSSEMKYDSGTGWPSFFTSIPGHCATKTDYKILIPRTKYHCVKCGGHQGHLFDDGPTPSGERWCNNGVALSFIPTNP
ncbi:MAG: peptide-methionine (R)-S-oxide reductase [Gammaproteobacteria bacterium]|nr:peptide-methionine (R)-S-oxide reductase [Gammaproteobacteria bacterium]